LFADGHRAGSTRRTLLDLLLTFLFAAALIKPLFFGGYLDVWGSIENTFIADARFLVEHWPHPGWQPLWYAGTRFDYIYPPALRYGTAILAMIFGVAPVRAYHAYTAIFYSIGISGVYALVWVGTRSRGSAWLATLAAALVSPSFLFLSAMRHDSQYGAPQRLHVLLAYGEGPHISALALLPVALAFAWLALERRSNTSLALAAIFCAGVVANNFYGGTALALLYAILVFSFAVTRGLRPILLAAAAIPLLAYGLTAFWLVPSYIRVTSEDMLYVANPGNGWSLAVGLIVAMAFAGLAWRIARGRQELTWALFLAGATIWFLLNVAGNYFFNFRITGMPHRWVPELDLVLILSAVAMLRLLWRRPWKFGRAVVFLAVGAMLFSARHYVRHAWELIRPFPDYRTRAEYRVSDWLWHNLPDARVKASGSVRLWFDAWHDLPQLGGGSDQGLINGITMVSSYEANVVPRPEESILWMQAMGVDAVYAAQPQSEEVYKELRFPQKFAGILPVIFDDGRGNVIYKVPRRYPARARVVETARLNELHPLSGYPYTDRLRAYLDVVEHGPDSPVSLRRASPDTILLRAHLDAGQSILVQESYDPAWRASLETRSGMKPLAIRKDILGFMVVDAPPGDQEIVLRFTTPLENRIGRVITALTMVLLIFLITQSIWPRARWPRRRSSPPPAASDR